MFAQLNPAIGRRQGWLQLASVVLHGLILARILYPPKPLRLTPTSVTLGQNGKSVTRLYWASNTPDDSSHGSSDLATQHYHHERLGQQLTWKAPAQLTKNLAAQTPVARVEKEDDAKTQTLSALGQGAHAGLPYGTLNRGTIFGDEIRPALPVTMADPVAYPWELPDAEGNIVVEIVIDEQGEIISKKVLQSMGPRLDEKVLIALESWHFHPATRNGTPIPSKQDAIFHFRARG